MTRPTPTPLRNPRTVGSCEVPARDRHGDQLKGEHCNQEARLYPCGWRCPDHSPARCP